ncbi:MAG: ABC transporter substrate-binding protein [Geobacteraceae bacterium GWC2_58_44]|nr:MAG: ABC transporter substrate-binding protein [Geobacteraceae bacterium GWC2_58_44]HBG06203.1 ABC transporter substrate-binding protein [Geobacter sp.]
MRALILCLALTLLNLLPARAAEILILQSNRSPGYSEALRGFHAACKGSHHAVVLSDYAEIDVDRMVKEERPRLVVALGDRALAAAGRIREVPVVALLALSQSRKTSADNIGGITMLPAPEQYLKLFLSMEAKRFGVLYDPNKTGRYLKRIEHESKQLGLKLVAEPVTDPRDIQAKLEKIRGSVDVLWMLPDSTVFTTVNLEAFIRFSMTNKVPVVTFSSHYLKNGAAASLDIDYFDIGVQAGEMAVSMLNSGGVRRVPTLDPRKALLHINESVIRNLGVPAPGL